MAEGDIFRFTSFIYDSSDKLVLNTFYYRQTGAGLADIALIGSNAEGAIAAMLLNQMSSTWVWSHLKVERVVPGSGGAYYESAALAGTAGSVALADTLIPPLSYCVERRSGLSGRSQRGRLFLGGWDQNMVNQKGEVSNSGGEFNGCLTFLIEVQAWGGLTLAPVLYHRATGTYDYILESGIVPTVSTRRTRKRDVGV